MSKKSRLALLIFIPIITLIQVLALYERIKSQNEIDAAIANIKQNLDKTNADLAKTESIFKSMGEQK